MSRSNPNDHLSNPSTRWFEWNGEKGEVRYYDRDSKANIDVPLPFTFLLLDEVATVRGWNDQSSSGIYSNEIRDTTTDVLVVKAFKGGVLAEGKYRDIKKDITAAGGKYVASCYLAYKNPQDETGYALGNIQFKGASLGAWLEFRKQAGGNRYTKAIRIEGFSEGKKGRVVFRVPVFVLADVGAEANFRAKALDEELQAFLTVYMQRNKRDQAEASAPLHASDDDVAPAISSDDIPF
jgi:hypothetical protein